MRLLQMTQTQLARKASLSRATISHLENGRYLPTQRVAERICRVMNRCAYCKVSIEQLMGKA